MDAEKSNPGAWGNHSRVAAHCAKMIALLCDDMDDEKAYVLGLLHDIGRKYGVRHLGHVSDGYTYMMSLGYDEVARVCMTHSFSNLSTVGYIGKFDTTQEELKLINTVLENVTADDYDKLIQLCDCLAGTEGVVDIMAGFVIVKDEIEYNCSLRKEQIAEYIQVNDENIPLQSLEDWRNYYDLMGRTQKVEMIDK
ncbi:MAG: HDOD domain-containing protein [Eubacteriales bacterium]|nr:HDOD domain-containing protein [Eubacteriales bacterium]